MEAQASTLLILCLTKLFAMSNNEKKYGKVITIRLRPENSWLVEMIDKDIQKEKDGKKIVSGRSEFVELILINYYHDRVLKKTKKETTK